MGTGGGVSLGGGESEGGSEDKHNRKRSPMRNGGRKSLDAQTTTVKKIGDMEDTTNRTSQDRMNIERGTL